MKRYALVFLKAGVIAPRSEESDGSRLCRKAWAQAQFSRSPMQSVYARLSPAEPVCPTVGTSAQPTEQQLGYCRDSLRLQSHWVAGIDSFFFFNRNYSIPSGTYSIGLSLYRY